MPRKLFKRWLPNPAVIKTKPGLKLLGKLLDDPNLFHLNRHSVSTAFFVGLFCCFLPIPTQMLVAAVAALIFRCNLPIAIALVWISNPATFFPIFYATYELGRWMLNSPEVQFTFKLTWSWFETDFPNFWKPLLVGSLTTSIVSGATGYFLMQGFWRWHVMRNWQKRKKARKQSLDQ